MQSLNIYKCDCLCPCVVSFLPFLPPYPYFRTLYPLPVRQVRDLLTASFRFRLTADTLAVCLCASSLPTRSRGFHPLEDAHARQTKRPTPKARRFNRSGAPRGTRTLNLLIRSQVLYPIELVAPDQYYTSIHTAIVFVKVFLMRMRKYGAPGRSTPQAIRMRYRLSLFFLYYTPAVCFHKLLHVLYLLHHFGSLIAVQNHHSLR